MNDLESELQKATKIKKKGNDRQEYLKDLAEAGRKLDNDAWEELSAKAQKWVNDAITALNDEESIPDFADAKSRKKAAEAEPDPEGEEEEGEEGEEEADAEGDSDNEEEEAVEDDDGEEEESEMDEEGKRPAKAKKAAGKKTAAKKAAPAKKAAKKAAPKKAAKANGSRVAGAQTVIKQLMLKDPQISKDALVEKLKSKGLKATPTAIGSIRSGMRHTMKVMSEAGVLHKSIPYGRD